MFIFLGKMTGLAIRHAMKIGIDLPTLFWKAIVGDPIEVEDVHQMYPKLGHILNQISDTNIIEHSKVTSS